MSQPALPPHGGRVGIGGAALITVGVAWLAVAGMIAVVIRLQVPTPVELLNDVAGQRGLWIASNAVLIAQQAVLILGAPVLATRSGAAVSGLVRGLLAMTGGALTGSGVFHGVFGAHLASKVNGTPVPDALALDAELVHALADTCWFVGVGAMTTATAAVSIAAWRSDPLLARVGVAAAGFNLLQFGWFFDHVFGLFAGPGTALQVAWFVIAGWRCRRDAATGSAAGDRVEA